MFRLARQGGQTDLGGMARAELLFLNGEDDIRIIACERLLNVPGLMTHDNDDGVRARLPRCGCDMADHRFSAHGMEHFRQRGPHAFSLAGRKDDGGESIASMRQEIYLRREGEGLVRPNSRSFLLSVLRFMPNRRAACTWFPPASRSTSSSRGFSTLRMV